MKELEDMSGVELLAKYNELSPTKRRAKFDSKEEAIKRIKALAPSPQAQEEETVAEAEPSNGRKIQRGEAVIRILSDQNPRREGTDSHRHFECMRGGITVEQYLSKFKDEDRRTARQWLRNTIVDGHVKLVGG